MSGNYDIPADPYKFNKTGAFAGMLSQAEQSSRQQTQASMGGEFKLSKSGFKAAYAELHGILDTLTKQRDALETAAKTLKPETVSPAIIGLQLAATSAQQAALQSVRHDLDVARAKVAKTLNAMYNLWVSSHAADSAASSDFISAGSGLDGQIASQVAEAKTAAAQASASAVQTVGGGRRMLIQ